MTSTDKDILGERTALERLIYDLRYTVDTRKEDGCSGLDSLGPIGLSVEYTDVLINHLESILAKYMAMDALAKQSKNQTNISKGDRSRMISSATMIRSVRELLTNIILAEPAAVAINRAALLILDSAVDELERND